MLLRNTALHGGVDAISQLVEEVEFQSGDLHSFLEDGFDGIMQAQPEAAIAWIMESIDEEGQRRAIPNAISNWANRDFNAAGEYLGTMPPSDIKDRAIQRFAQTVALLDPEAAAEWSLQIGDERLRHSALQLATAQWRNKNDEAAKQWLKEHGLDQLAQPLEATNPQANEVD